MIFQQTDTYVKIQLLSPRGRVVAKSKTTVRRMMTDPEYNESFVFQMSELDLREVTVRITVLSITKAGLKKDEIGWFAFGKNATTDQERNHWQEMIDNKELTVRHWHTFCDVISLSESKA